MKNYKIIIRNIMPSDGAIDIENVVSVWKEANSFFQNSTLLDNGVKDKIYLDISSIVKKYHNLKPENCSKYFESFIKENGIKSSEELHRASPLGSTLGISTNTDTFNVDRFIQQLYLSMNLAYAGSCNLFEYYQEKNGPFSYLKMSNTLSGVPFEDAAFVNRKYQWPRLERLDFFQAWEWIEKQNLRSITIAKTPVQKACALLLRLSMGESHYAEQILIITQVLEAMLLKKGEPKAYGLDKKLEAILGRPSKSTNWLKRLYNLRSSITHGEHSILWPDDSDEDKNSEESILREEMSELFTMGVAAVISLLQDLVREQKTCYDFSTQIHVHRR